MDNRAFVKKSDILNGFRSVGLREGDNVMVHASLSSMGFVCGGAQVVIEALIETVGESGTIMMPTQSWKNMDPESGVYWEEPKEWWQDIRDNLPPYDKDITPTNTMGAVAEMFRKWPGTLRSDHPVRSVAARGSLAEYFVQDHDLSDIFGETSPIAKLYENNGKVLLIGVDHDKNTSLHLADERAEYPGKTKETVHCAMMVNGKREWIAYETLAVDGEDFVEIGQAFEEKHDVQKTAIGNAEVRLMSQRQVVDFAVSWIEANRK